MFSIDVGIDIDGFWLPKWTHKMIENQSNIEADKQNMPFRWEVVRPLDVGRAECAEQLNKQVYEVGAMTPMLQAMGMTFARTSKF